MIETTAAAAGRPASHAWALALGIAVSAVCLWLASRNVEWSLLSSHVRRVQLVPFLGGLAAIFTAFVVMAYRWRTLLAHAAPVSIGDAFDFTMIGFLAGLIVPQRLGDVAKVVLLARSARVSRTTVLGSVVLERLSDVIMLLLLAAVFALTVRLPILLSAGLIALAAVTPLVAIALWFGPAFWQRLLSPLHRLLPHRRAAAIEELLVKFGGGVQAIRNRRQFGMALALAALVWLLSGLSMSAYIVAFGLRLPWYAGFLVILLTNLGGILPSSPGSIGVYHYMTVLALTVWTPDRTSALTFAIVTHAVTLLLVAVVGAWSLARQGLSLRSLRAPGVLQSVSTGGTE